MINEVKVLPIATKTCTKCNETKSVEHFSKHNATKYGIRPYRKSCANAAYRKSREDMSDGRKNVVSTDKGRVCNRCDTMKPWGEYLKDKSGFNKKTSICKDCRNAKNREIYKNNPIVRRIGLKNRPDKLKLYYGIDSWETLVNVLEQQGGKCANASCGRDISLDVVGVGENRAVIDHCHTTGKFRALLCSPCNTDLGVLETHMNRLSGLIEYLKTHSQDKWTTLTQISLRN